MAIRIVRLGSPRAANEGLRIGTVRRPPRGVKRSDFARLDWFDLWLPELSPSQALVREAMAGELTPARFAKFEKSFRRQMAEPSAERLLLLFAALSLTTDLSVGCYCADESRCHRSVLRQLLTEHGAKLHG